MNGAPAPKTDLEGAPKWQPLGILCNCDNRNRYQCLGRQYSSSSQDLCAGNICDRSRGNTNSPSVRAGYTATVKSFLNFTMWFFLKARSTQLESNFLVEQHQSARLVLKNPGKCRCFLFSSWLFRKKDNPFLTQLIKLGHWP